LLPIYLDEDALSRRLQLATRTFTDVLTATEAGHGGLSDREQLEFAAAQQRVLVTFNIRDFSRLNTEWAMTGRSHAGIICVTERRANPEVIAGKLRRLLDTMTPEDLTNTILFVNGNPNQRLA